MTNIKINESLEFINSKVPEECVPKRFAIATNLVLCLENSEGESSFLVFNYEPERWNQWYPFFGSYNGLYNFNGGTYAQLIEEFKSHILNNAAAINRLETTKDQFAKLLNIPSNLSIEETNIPSEMWLKFSKTQNIWTFYYMEFYQVVKVHGLSLDSIDGKNIALIPLNTKEIDNIKRSGKYKKIDVVDNTIEILKNKKLINELTKHCVQV